MKKILSAFLALAMLVSMMAVMSIGASAEVAPLTAKIYTVAGDPYAYLVFNKQVKTPAVNGAALALVGIGWPVDVEGQPVNRYLQRTVFTFQEVYGESGQVWKMAFMNNGAPSADHIPWGLGGLNIAGEDVAVTPNGGHWLYALYGDIVTADGYESISLDIEEWYDPNVQPVDYEGHTLCKATDEGAVTALNNVSELTIPTPIESIKPAQPDNPSTGDIFTVCVAVASLSAAGLAISKKRR